MKMIIFNQNDEIVETFENQTFIISRLLGLLFNKTIAKSRHIKRITYNYNYSNNQSVKFIFGNDYKYEFTDIPTTMALLDEGKIEKLLKGGE